MNSEPKGPKHSGRPHLWGRGHRCSQRKRAWAPSGLARWSRPAFFPGLTRAPLLSRIMKMMKVSNQLCSTMRKQVFRRIHQDLPSPSSMLTWQHLNRWTQPGTSGRGGSDRGSEPRPDLPSAPSPRPHQARPHHTAGSTVAEPEWLIQTWRVGGRAGAMPQG